MFSFSKKYDPLFLDTKKQDEFDNLGFTSIQILDEESILKLTSLFQKYNENKGGFFPTTYSQNNIDRKKISHEIIEIVRPFLEKNIKDYKIFAGSFIAKYPDKKSELGIHQDMTLLDESKFIGVNIWIPLCEINNKNGAVYILPKSNRLIPSYRNASIPNIYDLHSDLIKKYTKPVFLKEGEALIFDHSIIHFSPPNFSNDIRIAVNVFISDKDARIRTCHLDAKNKNGKILIYEHQDNFIEEYEQFDNQNDKLPKIGKLIEETDYLFESIGPELLKQNYGELAPKNLINRIFDKIRKKING
ncbi:MAG: phytanoyl-CoA dioxygenase family protein [Bacteroidetes bacterium]|nr:phytanoyl-CoA dioxygenase family protein [Bacteroidota bacterium]